MEIDAITVKALRQSKGWTQQHLADACAISLRTVQRVEKEGSASSETLLGLCAVLEVEQKICYRSQFPTANRCNKSLCDLNQ